MSDLPPSFLTTYRESYVGKAVFLEASGNQQCGEYVVLAESQTKLHGISTQGGYETRQIKTLLVDPAKGDDYYIVIAAKPGDDAIRDLLKHLNEFLSSDVRRSDCENDRAKGIVMMLTRLQHENVVRRHSRIDVLKAEPFDRNHSDFVGLFNLLASEVYTTAVEKGWYEKPASDAERLLLDHGELSEAMEGLRRGNPPDKHIPEFTSLEGELADVVIRIMDHSFASQLRVGEAVIAKMAFNAAREHKHGGKLF